MSKESLSIKSEFLSFFKDKGCIVVPSDSLVSNGDKTLLFTSAGMVQFKQHFLQQSENLLTKATSCQKCFRTSDIDQVGFTTRHLTFFEMLGNFSFGSYFKEEAICWAWEFLTQKMFLPANKLYVTVHESDDEASALWQKIIPLSRIIKMDDKTNFWSMGDIGLCGPCSEILMDLGNTSGCGKSSCNPKCGCDRYLEIWNLVFMQFIKQDDGTLKNLPKKSIDTGMGLERLILAINGKKNIFDTDLFIPIIEDISEIFKIRYKKYDMSRLRAIADHARAITFLILDGVMPSNDGRGYVLRKILRRVLRYSKFYGYKNKFMGKLISTVFKVMEPEYPELHSRLNSVQSIVEIEEEKFLETINSGSMVLSKIMKSYKSEGVKIISGRDVFKLYDTYGFPCDLTKEIAHENGMMIDEIGFKDEQNVAHEKSCNTWNKSKEKNAFFYLMIHEKVGNTVFTGYDSYVSNGKVLALIKNGKKVDKLIAGDECEIILSKSSFYAQSGGQNSDKGKMLVKNFSEIIVENVFKPVGELFVHRARVIKGIVEINDEVLTIVDVKYREQIARHHTSTHLLHGALREFFGEHVNQVGSLVTSDYLRFDFTSLFATKIEDLVKIENKLNSIIRANSEVIVETMEISQAQKAGAMALFGEKYGNLVRTVSIKSSNSNDIYSIELCCGTHVKRTGDIGIFKIISESAVAAGIRRIRAVAGIAGENYILSEESTIIEISKILNVSKNNVVEKVRKYVIDYNTLKSKLNVLENNLLLSKIDFYAKRLENVNGINFLPITMKDVDVKTLKQMANKLKIKLKSAVLLLLSENKDNVVCFIVSITPDYLKMGINANEIAKAFATDISGYSGGRFDFAQGGSKNLSNLNCAIKNFPKYFNVFTKQ
ncbi:MAG: alanine--tRNA ligase [Endomicrobium sp.]|jgi:alanyl-tRNA synthetase|nr:alanine--tRNA ligase [Endomicrobium sp.]